MSFGCPFLCRGVSASPDGIRGGSIFTLPLMLVIERIKRGPKTSFVEIGRWSNETRRYRRVHEGSLLASDRLIAYARKCVGRGHCHHRWINRSLALRQALHYPRRWWPGHV